jgi:dolichyl-phosphate beta-glucosyltransferase
MEGLCVSYSVKTLSIIIPAFNESTKITRDLRAASDFFCSHNICGEIIVVDDGSSDNTAASARHTPLPSSVCLRVIGNDRHRGKGAAIRTGVLASTGEYVAFADSGVTVPFDDLLLGVTLLQKGECDIAHGSRRLEHSVILKEQDWDRRIASRVFHRVVMRFMHLPSHLTDTQCGFKIYEGNIARALYAECVTESFMFDIELIVRSQHHGYRIREFPLHWTCDRDSRLSFMRSPWHIIRDLLRIRRTIVHRVVVR